MDREAQRYLLDEILADYEAGERKGLPHFEASGNRHMPWALRTEVW